MNSSLSVQGEYGDVCHDAIIRKTLSTNATVYKIVCWSILGCRCIRSVFKPLPAKLQQAGHRTFVCAHTHSKKFGIEKVRLQVLQTSICGILQGIVVAMRTAIYLNRFEFVCVCNALKCNMFFAGTPFMEKSLEFPSLFARMNMIALHHWNREQLVDNAIYLFNRRQKNDVAGIANDDGSDVITDMPGARGRRHVMDKRGQENVAHLLANMHLAVENKNETRFYK